MPKLRVADRGGESASIAGQWQDFLDRAFGNRDEWIHGAILCAMQLALGLELDVRLVSHSTPSREITELVKECE